MPKADCEDSEICPSRPSDQLTQIIRPYTNADPPETKDLIERNEAGDRYVEMAPASL